MQNRTFLVLLRPICCEKLKIAPPHRKTAPPQTFEFRISAEKSDPISAKTFFFFFFFGDHLILGGKNLRISKHSEEFRLNFRTNRVKLIQGRLHFSHSFKIAPPFSKSWLRAWLEAEVGVAQNSSQVSQVAQIAQVAQLRNLRCALCLFFPLLRNLRCALCLFFQRLRNLRLRIGKSNICCALFVNFFPRCAITK